jgi:hypothetical protein
MSLNYSQLVQAVQDYVESTETTFVSQIPTFVRQAEERILRAVMIPELRRNATTTLAAGSVYLARPTDMLSVFSLAVIDAEGTYTFLLNKDVNFLREAYPKASITGVPRYYAQFDGDYSPGNNVGNFIIAPAPDAQYQVELHYYFDPPSIVDEGTSWLGENAESALLYGTLVEAYRFLKGDADLMQAYEKAYVESVQALSTIGIRSRNDAYRNGELA